MSSDPRDAEEDPDARDAQLMRQLALARGRPDGVLRAELILWELLARHEPNIRRIVTYRAYSGSRHHPREIQRLVFVAADAGHVRRNLRQPVHPTQLAQVAARPAPSMWDAVPASSRKTRATPALARTLPSRPQRA